MKNWKTSLIGAVIATLLAIQPLIEKGAIDWRAVGLAALIAVFGFVSKDFNKTGL